MENYEEILELVVNRLTQPQGSLQKKVVPLGISNRHIHLSQCAVDKLFGKGYQLTKIKDLAQPGQYACKECVTLAGPKGVIQKVRVLGPVRPETQVEILQGDSFKLGVKGDVRLSGDLNGTSGITIIGSKGSLELTQGVIVAKRHIHMTLEDAKRLNVCDGETVSIELTGSRGGTLNNVIIRAQANATLECHVDTEEANALGITPGTCVEIIKNK
ncbi:phosphate propanoyltransferase [Vagococcus humatus]|uniref:Phosphate propanoyltransferase n=1 Tax=Vagococcus humatus TaxID=1889241 RepID=A0A429Z517_9ENTE|nr:phosphate propanoyltransferase [Vagococcus humatus]RST88769.1 phosphate propanoyltransferase [Vagococcus humatus]